MNDLNIAIASADKFRLDEIGLALASAKRRLRVTAMQCAPQRLGAMSSQLSQHAADILVVDCQDGDAGALPVLEQIGIQYPRMATVVLSSCESADFLLQAMRCGVREVLPSSADGAAFHAAIERIAAKAVKAGAQQEQSGKVLAFASCKGGSGATFLAANLGYALAAQGDARVALLDLNLQFGDAALYLSDGKAAATIADAVQDISRLDEAFLKANMMQVRSNLDMLAAPADPARGLEIKPEHIDALIALAVRHYDYVILDLGRNLDALTIRALDHADTIFAVVQATLPFVRGAKRMLGIFESLDYPPQKVELVLNRFQKDAALSIKDLEAACGASIRRTVAHQPQVAEAAANQGIAVMKLAGGSCIARSLESWAADLLGKAPAEECNWFNRILKRA
jgi:pilus assembly protein CpaE